MSRLKATITTTSGIGLLGIFCTLSFGPLQNIRFFGLSIFDTFDFVSSNILLPLGGILICILPAGDWINPYSTTKSVTKAVLNLNFSDYMLLF